MAKPHGTLARTRSDASRIRSSPSLRLRPTVNDVPSSAARLFSGVSMNSGISSEA
jgi:hypothetical protein